MLEQVPMAGLRLQQICKSYGSTAVLNGIDLEVEDGEFLVLVGPSGCGKSTLLRAIAGLEQLTSGELYIDGERANDKQPKDRDIAMVFQSYALYPHMTVKENLSFGLRMRKVPRDEIERRIDPVAQMLGLKDLLQRYPKQLSGGQRQRVAMGRAIVRRPKAFLFDEPLSNLDAALRVQMRAELARLHQRLEATMIYVTHDQVEAMTLADRIVVLNAGSIQQVGAPLELYHRPANRFVAGFIGSPAMNFLPGRLVPPKTPSAATALELGQLTLALDQQRAGLGLGQTTDRGQEVIVGVRPESIRPAQTDSAAAQGEVEVVEPMGYEIQLHVRLVEFAQQGLGQDVVVIVRGESSSPLGLCRPGSTVRLDFPADQIHLFCPNSGRALGEPPAAARALGRA
jgi:ABC-type sugar transport system ATPase subunit